MSNVASKDQRLAAFRLGETMCLCVTSNLDAVTPTPVSYTHLTLPTIYSV